MRASEKKQNINQLLTQITESANLKRQVDLHPLLLFDKAQSDEPLTDTRLTAQRWQNAQSVHGKFWSRPKLSGGLIIQTYHYTAFSWDKLE